MTETEYAHLPAFFRAFPKARLEEQYAKNAIGLRRLQTKAERLGRKVNGYTADQLRAKADEYERLSHAS